MTALWNRTYSPHLFSAPLQKVIQLFMMGRMITRYTEIWQLKRPQDMGVNDEIDYQHTWYESHEDNGYVEDVRALVMKHICSNYLMGMEGLMKDMLNQKRKLRLIILEKVTKMFK